MATLCKTGVPIATVLLLLAAWPSEGEARCAISYLGVETLTPLDDALPRGADIVIALRPSRLPRTNAVIGSVTIGTEGMAGGALVLATPLAPGLARVSLSGMPPGRHTLRGLGDTEIPFTIGDGPLPPAPRAPQVSSITVENRGRLGTSVSGALDAPGAVAFVVEEGGRAIAYGLPAQARGRADLLPFGRCSARPEGLRAIRSGESVTLRAVDAFGRLSSPSAVVTAR
jgi:hypothetical protein